MPGEPPRSGSGDYFRMKDLRGYPDKQADIRILQRFIHGWEVWCRDGKPHRAATRDALPLESEWRIENGKRDEPKPFWVSAVWNHAKGRVQVFSFTQGTIYNQLKSLLDNKRWGPLDAYDVTIQVKGEGLETEYNVTPNPKEPLPEAVKQEWAALSASWVGPVALFSGGNPFDTFDKAAGGDGDIPF